MTTFENILILYGITDITPGLKQIDCISPCVCTLVTHRGRQNVVRTSVATSRTPLFSLTTFRRNLFVIREITRPNGIYMLSSVAPNTDFFFLLSAGKADLSKGF